jgi:phosphomannomutase
MKQTGKKLSELASEVTIYPQKLVNIRVSDNNGSVPDGRTKMRPSPFISASASSIACLMAGTSIMKQTGKKLSELASEVTIYPQKLVNIRVSDKYGIMFNN